MGELKKTLLFVGDESCGKSTLMKAFFVDHKHEPPVEICPPEPPSPDDEEYISDLPPLPTCVPAPPPGFVCFFSPQTCCLEINGKETVFDIEECGSRDCYSTLRSTSYEDKDAIILCFSLDSPKSLENINKLWMKEVKQYSPNVPTILVGTKDDLRNDRVLKSVDGQAMAEKINAFAYVECSAVTNKGVRQVFETAMKIIC